MAKRGKFIVFEGGEGSGKSAHMKRLQSILPRDVIFTRNPGGTSSGEAIRELVLSQGARTMDAATEILLFLAARAQLITEVIAPALKEGHAVICDRYELSTLVYQIYGRQKKEYMSLLTSVSESIRHGCIPNTTIFLDVSPAVGLARTRSRPEETNRFDEEGLTFHERVRTGYKKHLKEYPRAFVIDADRGLEDVWTDIGKIVSSILK